MAQRWRNIVANGSDGAVVRHRFVPTDSDGWLMEGFDLTPDETAKMAVLPSWVQQDDPRLGSVSAKPAEKAAEVQDKPQEVAPKPKRGKGRKKKE